MIFLFHPTHTKSQNLAKITKLRYAPTIPRSIPFAPNIFPLFDGRGPGTNLKESQTTRNIERTTRAMAKRPDEDWNTATDGRETYLYMFQEVQNQA